MAFHYVYKIFFGQIFYIGVRSCVCEPARDDYWGSGYACRGSVLDRRMSKQIQKEILSIHRDRAEAEAEESRLIKKHKGRPGCVNLRRTSPRKYRELA